MPAKVEGIGKVIGNLEAIAKLDKTQVANVITCALVGTVEAEAKREVPVDTGNLRKSIRTVVVEANGNWAGVVGSPAAYAGHVEYLIKPYLRPAFDSQKDKAVQYIKEDIGKMIGGK